MSGQVRVEDLEVFGRFRVAMIKFAQAASEALGSADSEIARTHAWLETEQRTYWEGQLRRRTEAVAKAKEAVRQKKLYKDSSGRTPSAIEEEKVLAKCVAAVAQAEERLDAVKRWLPKLERAAGMYRGGVAGLGRTIGDDVPKSISLLDRLAESLHQYVEMENGGGAASPGSEPAVSEESMSRGGDADAASAAEEKQEKAPELRAPAKVEGPEQKEGGDVPLGQ